MESELVYLMASFQKVPCARIYGTNVSVGTSSTTLALNTIDFQKNGMTASSTSYSITVPVTGIYQVNAFIRFPTAPITFATTFNVEKNGSTPLPISQALWSGGYGSSASVKAPAFAESADIYSLSAGDTLTFIGNYGSASTDKLVIASLSAFLVSL